MPTTEPVRKFYVLILPDAIEDRLRLARDLRVYFALPITAFASNIISRQPFDLVLEGTDGRMLEFLYRNEPGVVLLAEAE